MGFSWLDGLIALVILALVLLEMRRDLGQALFDTIALLLGLRLALWLSPSLAPHLGITAPAQARGVALFLLFIVGSGAGLAVGYYLHTVTRWTMDTFDRVAGLMLGFSSAVIICHVLILSTVMYFGTPKGPPPFVSRSLLGQEALSFRSFHQTIDYFNGLRT